MHTFYRGDTRSPATLAASGFGMRGEAISAVEKAGNIYTFMLHNWFNKMNGVDLQRHIINAKDAGRPTISTALDEGCGGYDSGNIYKIEFDENVVKPYVFTADVMQSQEHFNNMVKKANAGFGRDKTFTLYMDNPKMDLATIIGIDLRVNTGEVAFVTPIPAENITRFKAKGSTVWADMP
ncbi:hypothetical protein V8J88_04640 [Massilia sp. W12]|uniref:hypothetical protein n=1 Tax=Massilia sp. W12 TaxID=3126507 RepID=UPI0030D1474F